jgi:hypothetical protein
MNGKTSREDGIELYHEGDETSLLFQNLVQNDLDWEWKNIKTKRMSATRAFLLMQKQFKPHPTHADFRRVKRV